MANRFILNETSYHGFGAIKNIVPEIQARGFKNILVASDASLVKFGVTQKVTGLLDEAGIKYELFTDIKPNPTIENVLSGVEAAKKINADAIIAIDSLVSRKLSRLCRTIQLSDTGITPGEYRTKHAGH